MNADEPGTRPVTFDQMVDSYAEQVHGLIEGGVDLLLPETSFDTLNMKACLFAISRVFAERSRRGAGDGLRDDLRHAAGR